MSTRPSFQFYPGDWRNNANLRRCSPTARAAWIDILCVLHDSDEYGVVRWPLKELAVATQFTIKTLHQLVQKNVLKGAEQHFGGFYHTPNRSGVLGEPILLIPPCDGSCWYSSRMVLDEWRRKQRGGGTRFTSDNQPPARIITRPVVIAPPVSQPDGLYARVVNGPSSSSSKEDSSERVEKTDSSVGARSKTHAEKNGHDVLAKPAKRGTRWIANAPVPRGWIEAARDKRRDLGLSETDLVIEAETFTNYWTAKPGAAGTKLDWFATWINWAIRNENGKRTRKPTAHDNFFAAARSILEDIDAEPDDGADQGQAGGDDADPHAAGGSLPPP